MDGCRDTHPTCELKTGKAFLWESGGGSRRSLHTNRSIAQIFVGCVFELSSHLYNFCCARIMFCIGKKPEGVINGADVQICALVALGSQPSTAPLSDWYHFCCKLKLAL